MANHGKRLRCFICGKRTKVGKRVVFVIEDHGAPYEFSHAAWGADGGSLYLYPKKPTKTICCCSREHYKLTKAALLLACSGEENATIQAVDLGGRTDWLGEDYALQESGGTTRAAGD